MAVAVSSPGENSMATSDWTALLRSRHILLCAITTEKQT